MDKQILEALLKTLRRPSRYINHELNSYPADLSAEFSVCLCYPDIYDIASTYLNIEILYGLINEKKLARCERCYMPADDLKAPLIQNHLPLFSLATHSPLISFDIISFFIESELAITNVLSMMSLAEINCFAKEREETFPLIVGCGSALSNPEPFCDFFDLFILGDEEETIEDIINVCKKNKGKTSKKNLLRALADIDGVYVPSLYNVEYFENGAVRSINPLDGVKPLVKKRILNLETAFFPQRKIIPFADNSHCKLDIEISRGCVGKCRFCKAAKYASPYRQRKFNDLLSFVKTGTESSGCEDVYFSSLAGGSHDNLDELLIKTNEMFPQNKLNVFLPPLRISERAVKIKQYVNPTKKHFIVFTPEAGTNRLRNVIGKYLSDKQILNVLADAYRAGWENIKLYFMIGLPTETTEDLAGIAEMIKAAKKGEKKLKFTVIIAPFVPKPQTPFQWVAMERPEIIEEKIKYLKSVTKADVKAHNHFASLIETLIAKGSRKVGAVIYKAWQKGAVYDRLSDKFNADIWTKSIKETGINLDFYVHRQSDVDEVFAWDHLHFGTDKKDLLADWIKGINETDEP
ncbi:MAG: TIGR03960 family B12-binding radical SAM protein, partial [Elusimicrobiota bacterium]|nr:TIGR03960 family B12-binding radical SAM protein [Elusimicrobiota bacterium]